MAPKRKKPPPPPPTPKPLPSSSSSDDDDQNEEEEVESEQVVASASEQDDDVADNSEEDDESSDDNEQQPQVALNPNLQQPQSESGGGDEEEEDGSDSESDSNPKPLASMPPARSVQPNPAAAQNPTNSKKKKLFQRLYSEDDELVVLKGMLQFKEETGKDAMDELNEYYEFAKDAIHVPVTKDQFVHKVKRLKGRYDKNLKNRRETFTNKHEQALYDVSKKIWGTDLPNASAYGGVKRKRGCQGDGGVGKKVQFGEVGTLCLRETVRSQEAVGVRVSEEFLRRSLELVGEGEKAELDREFRELLVGETEMHLKRLELVRKVLNVSLTATKAAQK